MGISVESQVTNSKGLKKALAEVRQAPGMEACLTEILHYS
jgi:hypothetical protein